MVRNACAPLARQHDLQVRIARERMTSWIPWIFVCGLLVSAVGLAAALLAHHHGDASIARPLVFAMPTALFGWAVGSWLAWPRFVTPRVVPCFAIRLGEHRGPASAAFWDRGRGLYRDMHALDELASRLDVTPLSAFGFADEYYDQQPAWHGASSGLATVQALRRNLPPELSSRDLAADLEALESVLLLAAERDVSFHLVLRLHGSESLQVIATREARQGSFW